MSFTTASIQSLLREECVHFTFSWITVSYFVCEKSDGIRVLVLMLSNGQPHHGDTFFVFFVYLLKLIMIRLIEKMSITTWKD